MRVEKSLLYIKISDGFVVYVRGRVGYGLQKRVVYIVLYNAGSNPI